MPSQPSWLCIFQLIDPRAHFRHLRNNDLTRSKPKNQWEIQLQPNFLKEPTQKMQGNGRRPYMVCTYVYVCRIYSLACYLASSSRRNPLRYVAFDELNPKWPMGQQKNQKQKIHNTKYKITAAAPAIQCRKPSKQAT